MPELQIYRDGDRVRLEGDIRTPADRQLIREIVDAAIAELKTERPELVLDISAANYLDSFALVQLAMLARKCVDCGMVLAIEGASDELLELLRVTRLDQLLASRGTRIQPARVA